MRYNLTMDANFSLGARLLSDSAEKMIVLAVGIVGAYLILINLDYVTLWHDEGTNAIMARSLAQQGALSGWDGRNLFFGIYLRQYAIDDNFNIVYPPWPAVPSALGTLLFGDGELAIRLPHALLGALSLPIFYLLLRLNFPARRRLRLFAFALFALSPIVILYMRQGRYYPDTILFTLLCFYCYQRFWRDGDIRWLIGMSAATLLNFFNHFTAGFTVAAALALWHVSLYWRETTIRQWVLLASAGAFIAAICGGYLIFSGILGGDNLEYGKDTYQTPWLKRHILLAYYYFRDMIRTGWLPLWVAVWWACYIGYRLLTGGKKKKRKKKSPKIAVPDDSRAIFSWAFMAALLLVITAVVSVQPVHNHQLADMRYLVAALPFILFMCAVFVDWVWDKNKIGGGILFVLLAATNLGGYPYLITFVHQQFGCQSKNFVLPALVQEIHRPYRSAIAEVSDYLRRNAAQDDTIFVQPWPDYAVLLYYMSDKLIFCCGLPDDSTLPRAQIRQLGVPIYESDAAPEWQVRFGGGLRAEDKAKYEVVYVGDAYRYPTQRPELEFHCFTPPAGTSDVRIYRRIK